MLSMILDIQHTLINQTGIHCCHCGGNLVELTSRSITVRLLDVLRIDKPRTRTYQCLHCRKEYLVVRN